ncbi:hypothetical protein [Sulfoacidibacillus thermotolerans]|nr:hypothetical protein [Sulfoacidibacillus thermotolerans]
MMFSWVGIVGLVALAYGIGLYAKSTEIHYWRQHLKETENEVVWPTKERR